MLHKEYVRSTYFSSDFGTIDFAFRKFSSVHSPFSNPKSDIAVIFICKK